MKPRDRDLIAAVLAGDIGRVSALLQVRYQDVAALFAPASGGNETGQGQARRAARGPVVAAGETTPPEDGGNIRQNISIEPPRSAPPLAVAKVRGLDPVEARLIDEAIAAGRVTRLPANHQQCIHFGRDGKRCGEPPVPGGFNCARHANPAAVRQSRGVAYGKAVRRAAAARRSGRPLGL